jgi:hypothetical protein
VAVQVLTEALFHGGNGLVRLRLYAKIVHAHELIDVSLPLAGDVVCLRLSESNLCKKCFDEIDETLIGLPAVGEGNLDRRHRDTPLKG